MHTGSPENFDVIFEILPLTRNERATKLCIADLEHVVALMTGMLLFKLTFFPHRLHSHSNPSTAFCFTEQIQFSFFFTVTVL